MYWFFFSLVLTISHFKNSCQKETCLSGMLLHVLFLLSLLLYMFFGALEARGPEGYFGGGEDRVLLFGELNELP